MLSVRFCAETTTRSRGVISWALASKPIIDMAEASMATLNGSLL
ncbi:MAG: hypothetical protein NT159_02000 [Proteobacteria bacterium]|nr:hypothetical protein [Pseudomonadota bacterium]